ncbi:MAG: hypothetical protein WAQ08_21640 [Aquabacterium sp.]|uniref:hypothetical protein n=1 Tax=Aquabacterium sp. TaxID=1872578 RepID=UPI003BAF4913
MSADVEIEVRVKRATTHAILVDHGGKAEAWVPISQISDWCDGPDDMPGIGTTSIFIPEWLATEKGMV